MGIPFSSPCNDLNSHFEAADLLRISFGSDDIRDPLRSVGFKGPDSESSIMRSFGFGNVTLEGSLSFKLRETQETNFSVETPGKVNNKVFVRSCSFKRNDTSVQLPVSDSSSEKISPSTSPESRIQKNMAALKLQKVYKSFRTRRKLADCAVLVEQKWWKLLDFAELKRSSISFFDIEKPETAVSRWSRARTKAAKVGKGLSKDEKARKLALQHWLEAIDPRHRYGHNLQFYYVKWLQCESKQPFFYWLDIGEGKEVNLVDRCPRPKLQQQCIKYLGPTEREDYEVEVDEGKFFYKQCGKLLDTTGSPKDAKWIFVLSASKTLYVGLKNKGTFQHSSFLAGGATLSAGRLVVENGNLKAVWPHSGHYLPTEENFQEFMSFLKEHNVDLANVQKNPIEEEVESLNKGVIGIESSESSKNTEETDSKSSTQEEDVKQTSPKPPISRLSRGLHSKITTLEKPKRSDVLQIFQECVPPEQSCDTGRADFDGYETAEESFLSEEDSAEESYLSEEDFSVSKLNLFDEDEEEDEKPIPQEMILQRINSHRKRTSYQLAKQLSCKWTTGAGPRIGCVRDYPSGLQFQALEQVNLSPRHVRSPKIMAPRF